MEEGPTLVIAEKPSTARSIAKAFATISGEKPTIRSSGKVRYYEVRVEGKQYVVSPAAGHLFGIAQKSSGWSYPVFDIEWRPSWQISKSATYTKPYLENFVDLGRRCSSFISATDYDREGSVIAYNILRLACGVESARRMKFSTLTVPDLIRSFESASSELDLGQIRAGLTRHVLDWYWGVNITRALTLAMKPHAKGFGVLSSGRVQGPTLKMLAEREKEIGLFVPQDFWTLELLCTHEGVEFSAVSDPERIWKESEADAVYDQCVGKNAIVSQSRRSMTRVSPGPPFDLTTLQTEAYRHFGFSPSRTMSLAQSLYESALISYPRTSSQKLPATIGYARILHSISAQQSYRALSERLLAGGALRPREGSKTDPAHPAIYPTGSPPGKLRADQAKLYDLIVRRFLSVFAAPAKRESVDAVLSIGECRYRATGRRTIEANWIEFYGPYAKFEESSLPHLAEGEEVDVLDLLKHQKQTQPPKRYTQASIVKEMERRSLGTKATRASIVQTLYDRGYVVGSSIEVTELGLSVVDTLSQYCPRLISESLTSRFEAQMERVEEGDISVELVLKKAEETLREILASFKREENEIGRELAKASMETKSKEREIGPCPSCGRMLRIITSRRTGKRFIGCSGYSKGCRYSAPLPQTGKLTVTKRGCQACGQPLISVYKAGKRPWTFCFNLECPLKKEEAKQVGSSGEGQEEQEQQEQQA